MKKLLLVSLALSFAGAVAAQAQPMGYGHDQQSGRQGGNYNNDQRSGDQGSGSDQNQRRDGQVRSSNQWRDDQSRNNQHAGWARDMGASHQWRRGERMGYNDWNGARAVDYRQHHFRRPPSGYEWRQSNGQYVLGAIATGLIASTVYNRGR